MAFEDFSKKKHPGGYKGIRVTGTLGTQRVQEYFKQSQREAAELLWELIENNTHHRASQSALRASQQYNYSNPRYDPPRRTGVVGITMHWEYQHRCSDHRYYPFFNIFNQDKTKDRRHSTARKITRKRGLIETWRECCQLMATWREYDEVPPEWDALCPTPEDWDALRRYYNEHQQLGIHESEMDVIYGRVT